MPSAEMLRADARRLIAMARNHADPQLQRELAAQALELSEIAEAIERTVEDREIIEANIIRYGETSHETQKIVEGLLAEAEKILAFLTRKDTVPESPAEKRSSRK